MSPHKRVKPKQNLIKKIWKLFSIFYKWSIKAFLRKLFVIGRKRRFSKAGFVLPTTVLVLLVATLVVSALLFRTLNRTTQVIGEREQKVIYNTATPAIDRAKAKIEYLFKKDSRLPNGVPSSEVLLSMMLNDNSSGISQKLNSSGAVDDIYTFPRETRLDLNQDGTPDNAWVFQNDINGDGNIDDEDPKIAYSILLNTEVGTGENVVNINSTDQLKANNLIVRNGPIAGSVASSSNCVTGSRTPEKGWYPVNNTSLRKNFQVDAFVVNNNAVNRTVTTLELQQDRQVDRGNKWGVWFRNDLEIFPGPSFNTNGAMHTEGNLIVGGDQSLGSDQTQRLTSYMLSSYNSCFYTQDASQVTVAKTDNYEGQIVSGRINNNSFGDESTFHLFSGLGQAPVTDTNTKLNKDTDSIAQSSDNLIEDISLDPVALFTNNESKHRKLTSWSRDTKWTNRDLVAKKRIFNNTSPQPYVDDTYRADNRYGPKPNYSSVLGIPSGGKIGDEIVAADDVTKLTNNNAPSSEDFGLDGYWERRARADGLRIIVGQRLDLGNTFGWGAAGTDSLNPPTATATNEQRQRRTLRDNLAAVQATAIYHREKNGGYFPTAFLATTAHPGTSESIKQSTTFRNESLTNTLNIDFLGSTAVDIDGDGLQDTIFSQGTNGWEFEVVPGAGESESTFASLVNNRTSPLRKALTNLAYFAGDPDGAFPSLQEAQGSKIVHPLPELNMWGNFSNLRRVIRKLDTGTAYYNDPNKDLSIADKSTLHTAAGTLGMLAYNIQNYKEIYTAIASDNGSSGLGALGTQLFQLVDGTASNGNGEIGKGANGLCDFNKTTPTTTDDCPAFVNSNASPYDPSYYQQFTGADYFKAFKNNPGLGNNATGRELIQKATLLLTLFQTDRDRTFGFTSRSLNGQPGIELPEVRVPGEGDFKFKVGCSSSEINQLKADLGVNPEKQLTGLALALCSLGEQPKYPSLYYLFPKVNHDHDGNNDIPTGGNNHTQPNTEPYIGDLQDLNGNGVTTELNPYITQATVNGNYNYQVLSTANPDDFSGILLRPKTQNLIAGCTDTNWCLPTATSGTVFTNAPNKITLPNDSQAAIPFLDTALSNGREMMNVRVLNIDLDMLRRNKVVNDTWLPAGEGLVYAFREDAVREDDIARPRSVTGSASAAWTTYASAPTTASYRMNASTPQDPPVNSNNGISPKAVDYYADPDRRPYGFRLRNGASVRRVGVTSDKGLAFISDNPVYIQGNFNLHSTDETTNNLIEEFTQQLGNDWSSNPNFYTGRTTLEPRFAAPAQDTWRPVEILADGVTILSGKYLDGNVEDTFTKAFASAASTSNTSYQNQNRPLTQASASGTVKYWVREDFNVSNTLPVMVSKNGYPLYCRVAAVPCPSANIREYGNEPSSETKLAYRPFSETNTNRNKDLFLASETRVNAIIVSGLVPSRAGQSYGGLHNFPRFNENWDDNKTKLHISGAFLQLNFSTSATGTFDQDAWEPSSLPSPSDEYIGYYSPPNRRWGYDVGLQYAPAGPAAKRFVTPGNTRSEFYRELPVQDPYIKKLRCATFTPLGSSTPTKIDPNATCS